MIKLTIGFTRSNRSGGPDDYVPTADGYRPGAEQDEHVIEVEGTMPTTPERWGTGWAEAVFVATNAPSEEFFVDTPGAAEVAEAIKKLVAGGARIRSLSVGDTVTVHGRTYTCESAGWEEV